MIQFKRRQKGFSLVEMAIVLVIVGLLIGGGFSTLGAYLDNAKQSHTKGSLENTKKAILNYVKVNYYMPCPDTDNDGNENRASDKACSSAVGTVPFNSIGLGAAIASDDYGNVFAYGVDTGVTTADSMRNKDLSASYFSNVMNSDGQFPAFRLETPPTSSNPDVATSYTVCKKTATVCDATPNNVDVNSIPAIIVAFNENGALTKLDGCNAETGAEAENCDNDLFVWKKFFSAGEYDDQLVTISGYEIKEQVLDLLSEISLTINNSAYDGYDVIIKGDVDSANVLNIQDGLDNAVFIDKSDKYQDQKGSLSKNVNFSSGNDTLYLAGNIESGGSASMGDGDDVVFIKGGILFKGSVDLGKDNDTATIGGSVGGSLKGNTGEDVVTVEGDVTGSIDLGDDNDTLYIMGNLVGGKIDGGKGANTLYVAGSDVAGAVDEFNVGGTISNFETIHYNHPF